MQNMMDTHNFAMEVSMNGGDDDKTPTFTGYWVPQDPNAGLPTYKVVRAVFATKDDDGDGLLEFYDADGDILISNAEVDALSQLPDDERKAVNLAYDQRLNTAWGAEDDSKLANALRNVIGQVAKTVQTSAHLASITGLPAQLLANTMAGMVFNQPGARVLTQGEGYDHNAEGVPVVQPEAQS